MTGFNPNYRTPESLAIGIKVIKDNDDMALTNHFKNKKYRQLDTGEYVHMEDVYVVKGVVYQAYIWHHVTEQTGQFYRAVV